MEELIKHVKKRIFDCDERGEYEAVKAYNDVLKYIEDQRKRKNIETLTMGQISKICKVAPRTVAQWFDRGLLKGYRIPGSQARRVPVQVLREFMEEKQLPIEWLENFLTEE